MIQRRLVLLLLLPCCLLFQGSTGAIREFTCPIDGTAFEAYVAFSGTSFGTRLDFKRTGPIASPWPVPQCPSCGFVLFEKEFDDAQLAALEPFVLEGAFKEGHRDQPSRYAMGLLFEHLERPAQAILWQYVQATWQAEVPDAPDGEADAEHLAAQATAERQYRDAASKALHWAGTVAVEAELPGDTDGRLRHHVFAAYIAVELHRRLGGFDQAAVAIEGFRELELLESEAWAADLVAFQSELIAAEDSAPHAMRKTRSPEAAE